MSVKIRLARRGRRKQPFYHIIVADARSPRDGKFIEKIGSYNPMTKPATIELDRDQAFEWLQKGAQPTETARAILRFKGVMYKKHLQRGVTKGALTQEDADKLLGDFIAAKDAKIAERFEESLQEKLAFHRAVNGTPKKVYQEEVAEPEVNTDFQVAEDEEVNTDFQLKEEVVEEVVADATEAVEEAAKVVEEVATAAEEVVVEAKEEVIEAKEEVVEVVKEAVSEVTEDKEQK
ncbi:MAG: small subunit ribosomal protein S16 [Saprospiraceae bacterium]|jgi:small subunit ribosomal protein S16